jgi:arylsulfatase A-like enzyme
MPSSAIRDGDWKLIRFAWQKAPESYNLADDPGERNNLANVRPDKLAEFQVKLDTFLTETNALLPAVNPDPKTPFEKW